MGTVRGRLHAGQTAADRGRCSHRLFWSNPDGHYVQGVPVGVDAHENLREVSHPCACAQTPYCTVSEVDADLFFEVSSNALFCVERTACAVRVRERRVRCDS